MKNNRDCQKYQHWLVQFVDDELPDNQRAELLDHIKDCENCRKDLEEMQKWKGVSREMKPEMLPEMGWHEYWNHLYNRLERGISWILLSVGLIILGGVGLTRFIEEVLYSTELSLLEKAGVFSVAFGLVMLFISVLREKLMIRKYDKYREIER